MSIAAGQGGSGGISTRRSAGWRWLSVLAALAEDQRSVPSTTPWLTAACNFSSRGSDTPFWPSQMPSHIWHIHTQLNLRRRRTQSRVEGAVLWVDCLLCTHKALASTLNTTQAGPGSRVYNPSTCKVEGQEGTGILNHIMSLCHTGQHERRQCQTDTEMI